MFVNGEHKPILPWGTRTGSGGSADTNRVGRDGGKIVLDAGKGDDNIHVRQTSPGFYGVNVNGTEHTFSRAEMNRLEIRGGKGNDNITVDPSVDIPLNIDGGKGNDTIRNYANGANINGGKGNDVIFNRGSGVNIAGGKGNDAIDSAGMHNNIDGGKGADSINSMGFGNNISGGKGADSINSWGGGNNIAGGRGNDRIQSFGNWNNVDGGRGHDDVWSNGWGNRVGGGPGMDRVNSSQPWLNTLGCFGGWNNLGNLAFNPSSYAQGYSDGFRAGTDRGWGGGGFWGNALSFGAGAWGLDLSAALNINIRL